MIMKYASVLLCIVVLGFSVSFGQTDADREAIKRTALSYAEGWYEGNAEKMESALSPDLAKRIVRTNPQGQSGLGQMTAMALVQGTRGGFGKQTPKEEQQKNVTILDVMGGAATAKLEMRDWVDYMHIGKMNGKWVIINVLWEMKPAKPTSK
jgi:AAA+ superfamily predicted ATPase